MARREVPRGFLFFGEDDCRDYYLSVISLCCTTSEDGRPRRCTLPYSRPRQGSAPHQLPANHLFLNATD